MAHSHNTKEFRLMRSVVLWLHNFTCNICKHYAFDLHVHHADHNNKNNDIRNLMPLCKSCHTMAHHVGVLEQISYTKIISLLLKKVEFFTYLKKQ